MKKLALTIAVVIGLSLTTFANNDGGLFQRGATATTYGLYGDRTLLPAAPGLPTEYGLTGNHQPRPGPLRCRGRSPRPADLR